MNTLLIKRFPQRNHGRIGAVDAKPGFFTLKGFPPEKPFITSMGNRNILLVCLHAKIVFSGWAYRQLMIWRPDSVMNEQSFARNCCGTVTQLTSLPSEDYYELIVGISSIEFKESAHNLSIPNTHKERIELGLRCLNRAVPDLLKEYAS